jgi:hypothetical protein
MCGLRLGRVPKLQLKLLFKPELREPPNLQIHFVSRLVVKLFER